MSLPTPCGHLESTSILFTQVSIVSAQLAHHYPDENTKSHNLTHINQNFQDS